MLPEFWHIAMADVKDKQQVADWFNAGIGQPGYYSTKPTGFHYPNFITGKGFLKGEHSGPKNDGRYESITEEQFITEVLGKQTETLYDIY